MNPENPYQVPSSPAEPAPTLPPQPAVAVSAVPASALTDPTAPASVPPLSAANPLAAMQPGEQVIAEIKRHPVGLMGNYITAGIIVLLAAIGAIAAPRLVNSDLHHSALLWSVGGFVIVAAFVFLGVFITSTVYKGNRWIVTDDSLTQITQISLFSRQSSQLSLHNLEDVTVQQNGIFQSTFNFGTLRAETAGERSKFVFPYCPDPNARARDILSAREKFMREGGYGTPTAANAPAINGYTENQAS